MKQFLLSPAAQMVIWLSVLAVLVALGGFVVGRLRDRSDDERLTANGLLSNFRDWHDQGDIDAAEFRNIKTVLGMKLHPELRVSAEERAEKSESAGGLRDREDSDSAENAADR